MPYFVYVRGTEPTDLATMRGINFANDYQLVENLDAWRAVAISEHTDKAGAIAARAGNDQCITYAASINERRAWRHREQERVCNDTYRPVHAWQGYELHYLHVSTKGDIAKVAYTPDDCFGHEDRQLVTTPGRYLELFGAAIGLSPDDFPKLIAQFKAATMPLRIATSADDIARIYCAPSGPTSCMTGDKGFTLANTPVRVYGDSDLAVAYLGILGDRPEQDAIGARAVVWPERKVYGRTYGDEAIAILLQAEGYTSTDSFAGARLRAIDGDRRGLYVMPYIDGDAKEANLVMRNGVRWFEIVDEGEGEYGCGNCDGYASAVERNYCSYCDTRINVSDTYCESCNDQRWECAACNETYFDDDHAYRTEVHNVALCEGCYDNQHHVCNHCDTPIDEYDYSYRDRRSRSDWECCDTCLENRPTCSQCNEQVDEDDLRDHGTISAVCSDCRRKLSESRRARLLRETAIHTIRGCDCMDCRRARQRMCERRQAVVLRRFSVDPAPFDTDHMVRRALDYLGARECVPAVPHYDPATAMAAVAR